MYVTRAASRAAPAVLRAGIRTSGRPARSVHAPRQIPAIAILIPRRAMATETSTSGGSGGNYPPPGFNADQAKKPLPKEEQQKSKEKSASSDSPDVSIPKNEPTVHPPTKAAEKQSLTELAAGKTAETKDEKKALAKKEDEKKTMWMKVKDALAHYRDGTKLLWAEVKISSKLALKMTAGYELTRREHRQLQRTVQDLGRLVPFSVFIIVPFAELLLPVALKIFPGLLPSTYESTSEKETKAKTLRSTRKEVSNFLRQTLKDTGLPVSAESAQREEFGTFFRKVRTTGESPSAEEIIKVCKIFKDDLTLDNLSRPQLVGICRYMNLNSFGTDNFLRYQVRVRMRQIKRDDRAISYEGVESLSVPELQTACASRGLRTHGVSPARLREDLQTWLELRLKRGVPSTLLVLSNAFVYAQGKENEMTSQLDALQAVLSSIPEELYHEVELEVHTSEGAATNKQRLEVLKEQQELIEEENEQAQGHENKATASPKDTDNIDEDDKPKSKEESEDVAESKEAEASSGDSALEAGSSERTEQDQRAKDELEGKSEGKDEQKAQEATPKKE